MFRFAATFIAKAKNLSVLLILCGVMSLLAVTAGTAYAAGYGKPETIKIQLKDYKTDFPAFKDKQGNFLIPLQDDQVTRFLGRFNCRPTYLAPMETIVLGFPGGRDFRMKIGEKQVTFGKTTVSLKTAPAVIGDEPCIPLEALEKACGVKSVYDEESKTYCMDTLITDVSLTQDGGRFTLAVRSTVPLTYTTSTLEEPSRFIIDVDGAILDEGIVDRDIHDPRIGNLFVSQESLNPNRVRIVIPTDSGNTVEMVKSPADKNTIAAAIQPKTEAPLPGVYKQERVSDLRIAEEKDKVVFKILTTGPVQFEWRRLLPPDNRYFVDIPNCIYTAPPYNKTFDVGYLKSISVQQLRPMPDPVVRVTMDLHVPSKINVGPDPRYPGELHVNILSETINPRITERQGFGISEVEPPPSAVTVNEGVTVVIDPGHGGGDPGACNSGYNVTEKAINLDIALRLAKLLQKAGWNVVMTRTVDRDVTYAGSPDAMELQSRVDVARRSKAQIFVSIHNNASASGGGQGTAVYYYKSDSTLLAQHVNAGLIRANGRYNEGVLQGSYHVIRENPSPAILVECAYVSNPTEAQLLSTAEFRQRCAEGIYNGLMSYARARNLKGVKIDIEPTESPAEHLNQKKLKAVEEEIKKTQPQGSEEYKER